MQDLVDERNKANDVKLHLKIESTTNNFASYIKLPNQSEDISYSKFKMQSQLSKIGSKDIGSIKSVKQQAVIPKSSFLMKDMITEMEDVANQAVVENEGNYNDEEKTLTLSSRTEIPSTFRYNPQEDEKQIAKKPSFSEFSEITVNQGAYEAVGISNQTMIDYKYGLEGKIGSTDAEKDSPGLAGEENKNDISFLDSREIHEFSKYPGLSRLCGKICKGFEFIEESYRKYRAILLNVCLLYNVFWAPLDLAFPTLSYKGIIVFFEILLIVMLSLNFLVILKDYLDMRKKQIRVVANMGLHLPTVNEIKSHHTHESIKGDSLGTLILELLYVIPFGMIFDHLNIMERRTNIFLIALQLIRLVALKKLTWIFQLSVFKRRYALGNILLIIYLFIIVNHFTACMLITLANTFDDFNITFYVRVPAPQYHYPHNHREHLDADEFTIYIHALYWAYVVISDISAGDVTGSNSTEKLATSIVIWFSVFFHAILFGSLASIVDDLTPKYQKIFESNYRQVLTYVKHAKMDPHLNKIHQYYAYVWQSNKGINEEEIMQTMPNSIKNDIFRVRYEKFAKDSTFFKDETGLYSPGLFYSFFKNARIDTFMPDDNIISAGQFAKEIYFILEGEVEILGVSTSFMQRRNEGDYFGCILTNVTQLYDVKATKVTKIAVLPEKNFLNLKEAYPKWYARLMKEEKVYKVVLSIKQRIEEIVERRKSDKLNNSPTKNKKKKMLRINTSPNIAKKLKSAFSGNPIGYAMAKVVEGSSDDTSSKPNSARGSKPESQVATPQNRRGSLRQTPQSSKRLTPVNDVPQNNGLPKHPIDFDALNTSLRKFEVSENGDLVPSLPNTPKKKKESPTKKLPPIENPGVPGVPRKSAFAQPVTPNESPTKISPGKAKNKQFEVLTTPKKKNEYNMDSAIRESREFSEYDNSMMDAPSPMLIKKAKDLKKKDVIFVRNGFQRLTSILVKKKKFDGNTRFRYYVHPHSKFKIIYELIHTVTMVYSVFVLPLLVGFRYGMGIGFLIVEAIILLEQIAYLILSLRTAQFIRGVLTLDMKLNLKSMKERGFYLEIIALIPFNLIFGIAGLNNPAYIIDILKMNRVLLYLKLQAQITLFGATFPQINGALIITKPLLFLMFIWHFTSCLWSWLDLFNDRDAHSWYNTLDLYSIGLKYKYMFSLLFTMNIATTTGYPEMIVYNNYERALYILFIYFGVALFALSFGLFSANTKALPEKYEHVFEELRKMQSLIELGSIKPGLRNKIENYYSYIVDKKGRNKTCLEALDGLMPVTTLKNMSIMQVDKILMNHPIMEEFSFNKVLMSEITTSLEQKIYLPDDYIINKNEHGRDAYFILEGRVDMYSPNEKEILVVFQAGDYFGEFGIYTTTIRVCPFIAASFCLIYVLNKDKLKTILKGFPNSDFDFLLYAAGQLEIFEHEDGIKTVNDAQKYFKNIMVVKKEIEERQKEKNALLQASELPLYKQKKTKKDPHGNNKRFDKAKDFLKTDSDTYKEEDSMVAMTSLIEEYVEENEILNRDLDPKKTSFRNKTKKNERRYSRIKMGRELAVSKSEAVNVRWGVNLD